MTWLSKFGRFIDPTRKKSFTAGALRQLDPTNKNSFVGKVAPYAVGAIPGIGAPLAMGLGAGLRASQAVGRGEDLGTIAGSALQGAGEAGLTRGIARAVMPGTFAPQAPLTGIGRVAAAPDAFALTPGMAPGAYPPYVAPQVAAIGGDLTTMAANLPSAASIPGAAGAPLSALPPATTPPPPPNRNFLTGIGDVLLGTGKNRTGIAPLIGEGAKVYGAYQTGRAEDAALAQREEEFNRTHMPRAQTFDEWKRLRGQYGYGRPTA